MPKNYRPGLDVIRLAALLPVLCYHYCIEAARFGFAVPTAFIGRGMADWVDLGLAGFFLLGGAALCGMVPEYVEFRRGSLRAVFPPDGDLPAFLLFLSLAYPHFEITGLFRHPK